MGELNEFFIKIWEKIVSLETDIENSHSKLKKIMKLVGDLENKMEKTPYECRNCGLDFWVKSEIGPDVSYCPFCGYRVDVDPKDWMQGYSMGEGT